MQSHRGQYFGDSRVRLVRFVPARSLRLCASRSAQNDVRLCACECLGVFVFACSRFYCGGFLDFARNDKCSFGFIRVIATTALLTPLNDKSVRNLLSLPPRGKVDCRSIAKARRMRGKRRYVFIRFYSPHPTLGSLTLALVPPSPKGEGISSCHPITILLARFQPYLSAQPTVGRFALGPPHNVQPQIGI